MSIQRTPAAFQKWLQEQMPESFLKDTPAHELEVICHTLVYNEQLEEYVHLNFKQVGIVLSLNHDNADEMTLAHYSDKAVTQYRTYASKAIMPGYTKALRIARLGFGQQGASATDIAMPENCGPALVQEALLRDRVQYRYFEDGADKRLLCFAWRNVGKRNFVYNLACACRRNKLHMTHLRFAYLDPLTTKSVLLGVIGLQNGEVLKDAGLMKQFNREFELLKSFRGNDQLSALIENGTLNGNHANLIRAFVSILGQLLAEVNPAMYTEDNIMEAFCFHPELTVEFIGVFRAKFHPSRHDIVKYAELAKALETKLASLDTGLKKHDDRRRTVFLQALNIVHHILRTNTYDFHKLGIGFRLNPAYLDKVPGFDRKAKFPELPFGIYYVKGWNYFGFQLRFRDLARGGMRTVVAWNIEREQYERANMFTECYNLAFTQQKKNKDIPEGGSKSILFLRANEELPAEADLVKAELLAQGVAAAEVEKKVEQWKSEQQTEYMYYNQRCFLHTMLSLIVWDYEKNCLKYGAQVVDYLNRPEYIYLGPDENFHDSMIQWLAKESVLMGNYVGGAFISGKDHAGVNHKEYGVTSWGALQYLHQGLAYLNIKEGPFTVKITGGPDGDVAGNFMLLLNKYYKTRAKVLVVTDGSGTCYDPQGLDLDVLEEMFHQGMKGNMQLIHDYPRNKMHAGSWFLSIKRTRQATALSKECLCLRCGTDGKVVEDWISNSAANTLFANNAHTVLADVFLPCGGRPRALNPSNVQSFFDQEGKPTSRLVVEGANLYITQDAREYLEDRGVIIFKDSSANKCGVVSSSYEILAGLTMTDEQFMEVKPELAKNILARLELIANDEAKAMIAYFEKHDKKVRMSKIAEIVSQRINKFTDEIRAFLETVNLEDPANKALLDIFVNYIPECIRRKHLAQAIKRVPDMHKKSVIATYLACKLVYTRGLEWEPSVVDLLPLLLPLIK